MPKSTKAERKYAKKYYESHPKKKAEKIKKQIQKQKEKIKNCKTPQIFSVIKQKAARNTALFYCEYDTACRDTGHDQNFCDFFCCVSIQKSGNTTDEN